MIELTIQFNITVQKNQSQRERSIRGVGNTCAGWSMYRFHSHLLTSGSMHTFWLGYSFEIIDRMSQGHMVSDETRHNEPSA